VSINKNFVVKNGLEVYTDLVLANAVSNRVGIGSTNPRSKLDVRGGIAATDIVISGYSTVSDTLHVGSQGSVFTALGIGGSVGIGTNLPGYLLDIRSPVSTGQTALYVQGDVRITGDINVDDITFDDATVQDLRIQNSLYVGADGGTGVSTFVGFSTFQDYVSIRDGLKVTGIITGTSFRPTSGYYQSPNGTNAFYVYDTTGNVAFQGTIGASQVNSASGNKVVGLAVSDAAFVNNVSIANSVTVGNVKISSGIITAVTGIVTYYGDGSKLSGIATGLTATIGVGSESTFVGSGVTEIYFASTTGTSVNVVAAGTSAIVTITPGVSLGLAIALGG